jgi:Na+/H+ antiporter NhaA
MFKQTLFATVIVFIVWSLIDFLIHGMLLQSAYQETANLWRPEDQMHMMLMSAVTLVFSFCVVSIYSYLVTPKSVSAGFKYGLILGVGVGTAVGIGSFSYMPIPLCLAGAWFGINLVEITMAGIIAGYMIKEPVTHIGGNSL